jgi:hypothetical protein
VAVAKVCCISVVRDFAMYERCVKSNPLLAGCGLCTIDNRGRNDGVPTCYNRFLDSRAEDEDAWYVFCHEDFQMMEPLAPRLEKLDTEALWGPIGAVTRVRFGVYHQRRLVGSVEECRKDGTGLRRVGETVEEGTPAETFDCQCVIVHSSLVRRHALRFDEALTFDLYAEELCMAAKEKAEIASRVLPLAARHWSGGSVQERYYAQEAHVNAKYPKSCYTGTSSLVLGGSPPFFRRVTVAFKRLLRSVN